MCFPKLFGWHWQGATKKPKGWRVYGKAFHCICRGFDFGPQEERGNPQILDKVPHSTVSFSGSSLMVTCIISKWSKWGQRWWIWWASKRGGGDINSISTKIGSSNLNYSIVVRFSHCFLDTFAYVHYVAQVVNQLRAIDLMSKQAWREGQQHINQNRIFPHAVMLVWHQHQLMGWKTFSR